MELGTKTIEGLLELGKKARKENNKHDTFGHKYDTILSFKVLTRIKILRIFATELIKELIYHFVFFIVKYIWLIFRI